MASGLVPKMNKTLFMCISPERNPITIQWGLAPSGHESERTGATPRKMRSESAFLLPLYEGEPIWQAPRSPVLGSFFINQHCIRFISMGQTNLNQ
jgi:hypothetical protein